MMREALTEFMRGVFIAVCLYVCVTGLASRWLNRRGAR